MRRRAVLGALGSSLALMAGCGGDHDPAGESSPTRSGDRAAFRSTVEQHAKAVETVSLDGKDWTVAYHVEECCGEPFEAHQATLARNFSAVRPDDGSLTATAYHECMNIRWRVPAQLARKHEAGEIDTETFVSRVQNTTTRESQC